MPEPMRYWTVFSTMRMSTRPERYMYLPRMSPWRFSSAVQARVQIAQGQALAPVSSRTPSSVLIMVWYVGSASSVTMSPTSTTKYSSGSPAARARSSRTSCSNISDDESGRKSAGCQQSSTGLSSGSSDRAAQPSRDRNTSAFSGGIECVTRARAAGAATATAAADTRPRPRRARAGATAAAPAAGARARTAMPWACIVGRRRFAVTVTVEWCEWVAVLDGERTPACAYIIRTRQAGSRLVGGKPVGAVVLRGFQRGSWGLANPVGVVWETWVCLLGR